MNKKWIITGLGALVLGITSLTSSIGCNGKDITSKIKPQPRAVSIKSKSNYVNHFEGDHSYLKRIEDGVEANILDFDGITKLEFYNKGKLLAAPTSVEELLKIKAMWGGEGCDKDGELIFHSSKLPMKKPFSSYHLTVLYGYGLEGVDMIKVYDKEGNVRTLER